MKEYRSTTGGRYIFNEDMHNLQDLALSSAELFREGGVNFVISGCKITVNEGNDIKTVSVTAGYVYIDGKIRKVGAYSNTFNTINTIGIYVKDGDGPDIAYSDGELHKQYDEYAAEVKVNDSNERGLENIMATLSEESGYMFPDLRTGFLSAYCLVNKGTRGQYSLITVDDINAGNVNADVLEIGGINVNSLFLSLSGGVMYNDATIQFDGNETTLISSLSISTATIIANSVQAISGVFSGDVSAVRFIADNLNGHFKFLKADGTLDDTAYLPISGGTITGELICDDTVLFDEAITCNEDSLFRKDLTCQQTIEGIKIKKTGGTSAEFLKANGDTDSTPYAPLSALNGYLLITGGTLTGLLICNDDVIVKGELDCRGNINCDGNISCGQYIVCTATVGEIEAKFFKTIGGTAAQFVKGDGTLDGKTYITDTALNNILGDYATIAGVSAGYLPLTGGTISAAGNDGLTTITPGQIVLRYGNDSATLAFTDDKKLVITNAGIIDAQCGISVNGNSTIIGNITVSGSLTTTIITASTSIAVQNGGAVTAGSFITDNGASSDFVKGDGTLDNNTYLTTGNAASTYLTQANAAADYLTKTDAATTYLTQANAASIYLTQANAASIYLTQANAATTYITQTAADNKYLAISNAVRDYALKTELNDYFKKAGDTIGLSYIQIKFLDGRWIDLVYNNTNVVSLSWANDFLINLANGVDIRVNNDVYAAAHHDTSDVNLKNIISDVLLTSEQIANAPAVAFSWKNDVSCKTHVGTIAQYWQEVLPEVVSVGEHLSMNYGAAAMVSVISLAKEVIAIRQEIKRLKN